MLTYADMLEQIQLISGQHILADSFEDATMLDKPRLIALFKRELAFYSRFMPSRQMTMMKLWDQKVFTGTNEDGNPEPIPEIIIDIYMKTGVTQLLSYNKFGAISQQYWRYKDKVFTTSLPSDFYRVSYCAAHVWNTEKDGVETLDYDSTTFLNLICGRLLITMGRSRRSFMLNEIPFSMDGEALLAEGNEMYLSAKEDLETQSRWLLASM